MNNLQITRPTLLLDESKFRRNISFMVEKAKRNHVIFRPHFKTHQSHEIGRWFRDEGVDRITVSSLSMAEYFAEDGWDDITVAFPVNILEIDTINKLAASIRLNLLVESTEAVRILEKGLHHEVRAFIKIDIGNRRTGIAFDDQTMIDEVLDVIENASHITFAGFLGHAGQSYESKSPVETGMIHYESTTRLKRLKELYFRRYPHLILSTGDTPTCSVMEDFRGVDEIRPGNFVFYDLMQEKLGSCTFDKIAVAMACPVVAIHQERNEIVIYGGAVHFSKERLENESKLPVYGELAVKTEDGWGERIEGAFVKSLSQEHGIISVPDHLIGNYRVGDIILILPVHSCLTSEAMGVYLTTRNKIITRFRR